MQGEPRYWIAVASRDHVRTGVSGGFCQASHGKAGPLERMKPGDWLICYSSKKEYAKSEPCQCFTAIGQVAPGEAYRFTMANDFVPSRRAITFLDANEAPIQPLIESLTFIRDKRRWGLPFRYGFLKIGSEDFFTIATAMNVKVQEMENVIATLGENDSRPR